MRFASAFALSVEIKGEGGKKEDDNDDDENASGMRELQSFAGWERAKSD